MPGEFLSAFTSDSQPTSIGHGGDGDPYQLAFERGVGARRAHGDRDSVLQQFPAARNVDSNLKRLFDETSYSSAQTASAVIDAIETVTMLEWFNCIA